jgi:hypothetical protein
MKTLVYKNERPYDATAGKQVERVWIEWMSDTEDPWGCRAIAEISYPVRKGAKERRLQNIESCGLYGIDICEGDDAEDVEQEQLCDLAVHAEDFCGLTGMPLDAYRANFV